MKRQFLAISCCPSGTAIAPSGTDCTSGALFQCAELEPLCDKASNTCVDTETTVCGNDGQKCCGATCKDSLICMRLGLVGEECITQEEKDCFDKGGCNTNSVFCDPAIGAASGIDTAIGCIKVGSGNELITTILRLATGVGGGIALALILYGVFIVTTSAGMPDKLKAGSEVITSAIIGLIFILLSVFLVNLIGINILGIPGLS